MYSIKVESSWGGRGSRIFIFIPVSFFFFLGLLDVMGVARGGGGWFDGKRGSFSAGGLGYRWSGRPWLLQKGGGKDGMEEGE